LIQSCTPEPGDMRFVTSNNTDSLQSPRKTVAS
jgi:hypothetical protein